MRNSQGGSSVLVARATPCCRCWRPGRILGTRLGPALEAELVRGAGSAFPIFPSRWHCRIADAVLGRGSPRLNMPARGGAWAGPGRGVDLRLPSEKYRGKRAVPGRTVTHSRGLMYRDAGTRHRKKEKQEVLGQGERRGVTSPRKSLHPSRLPLASPAFLSSP